MSIFYFKTFQTESQHDECTELTDEIKKQQEEFDYTKEYYKVIRKDLTHFGYTYKHGLNEDPKPFSTEKDCGPGGLYFTDRENLVDFIAYGDYICKVTVPKNVALMSIPDPKQHTMKWKAKKIIVDLENKIPMNEFPWTSDDLSKSFFLIPYIKPEDQTYEWWLNILQTNHKIDGYNCQYVIHCMRDDLYDDIICDLIIRHYCSAIKYIPDRFKTNEFWIKCVKINYFLIYDFPKHLQKNEIYNEIFEANSDVLMVLDVSFQTYEICLQAVKRNAILFSYVQPKYITPELCMETIKKDFHMFNIIPKDYQTVELFLEVIKQNCSNNIYNIIPIHQTPDIIRVLLDNYPDNHSFILKHEQWQCWFKRVILRQ